MFEHLSKRMELVVSLANEIAQEYEQDYVGTEHLLIALAREQGGAGAQILAALKIKEPDLKRVIDQIMQRSKEDTWVFGRLPGTPHFRNVMAKAVSEAQAMKNRQVCTEHLLLALAAEQGSVACAALAELGVTPAKIHEVISRSTLAPGASRKNGPSDHAG